MVLCPGCSQPSPQRVFSNATLLIPVRGKFKAFSASKHKPGKTPCPKDKFRNFFFFFWIAFNEIMPILQLLAWRKAAKFI